MIIVMKVILDFVFNLGLNLFKLKKGKIFIHLTKERKEYCNLAVGPSTFEFGVHNYFN